MITENHFYHQTIKKTVSLFGTLFNNITIARTAGQVLSNVERVPISYGPKQKFLARIAEQPDLSDPKVAIKVPRLSFEITSIQYDTSLKMNRMNKNHVASSEGDLLKHDITWQSVPYTIGMQLNIYSRNQDDALQILEQILPTFQPDYTVTVKDMEAPGINANIPIVLNSVTLSNDYEGNQESRQTIIYTLEFTLRIRFFGPTRPTGIIRYVEGRMIPDIDTSKLPQ